MYISKQQNMYVYIYIYIYSIWPLHDVEKKQSRAVPYIYICTYAGVYRLNKDMMAFCIITAKNNKNTVRIKIILQ